MERITEVEEQLKELVCSAQLPGEQEDIIQRIMGDQLIKIQTKQEKLLSLSDEFHGKKLENIKSDIQKEITTTMEAPIKEAV